jgi:hypothetical protein
LLFAAALAALVFPVEAQAQGQPAQRPAPQVAVDPLTILRLVWSSLAALHHANDTGNYSVLRDMGAPSFQANNSAATLGGVFQALRVQQVDVSNALLLTPVYDFPPAIVEGGLLRVRGNFPLRPLAIGFDLLFQNVGGQWRIFGIAVAPLGAQAPQRRP